MTTTLKPNDIVYYEDPWSNNIIKAEVIKIRDNYIRVHDICYVDKNGNATYDCSGTRNILISDICASYQNAYEIRNERADKAVKDYCENIKNLNDLMRFPLKYCLNGEEYTDYNAVKAYKIRAHELLDIEL